MKKPGVDGGFILCLVMNMILNLWWTIPAWVLLVLHFVLGISLWWFVGALLVWFAVILGISVFLSVVSGMGRQSSLPPMTKEEERARDEDIRRRSANLEQELRNRTRP